MFDWYSANGHAKEIVEVGTTVKSMEFGRLIAKFATFHVIIIEKFAIKGVQSSVYDNDTVFEGLLL